MDVKKEMIIIDNKIETENITFCIFNSFDRTYTVKYKNSDKKYSYSKKRLKYLTSGMKINKDIYIFLLNNIVVTEIKEVIEFKDENNIHYYHVIFNDNLENNYNNKEFKKINKSAYHTLEYMKKISEIISLSTEDGIKLLSKQMKKIQINNLDNTALATYLNLSKQNEIKPKVEHLIFPFGCNASQYKAVHNIFYNQVSVIEGPPGTGKTQTILNMIANIIIRGMNCQVVSNNNTAIANIDEKLKKYEFDFLVALLGKQMNKDKFIDNQKETPPTWEEYDDKSLDEIMIQLRKSNRLVKKIYEYQKEQAILIQQKKEVELEYQYFINRIKEQQINVVYIKRYDKNNLKRILNEMISKENLSIWTKLKYIYVYRTGNFSFYQLDNNTIFESLQNKIYKNNLEELQEKLEQLEQFIKNNKNCETKYINLSMIYFKKYLSSTYNQKRKIYSLFDINRNYRDFLKDYPVILSTTYSSKNTFHNDVKFDYIIMDEASQIDVVTGTLALSTAKCAVIIGDEKQLPNVIPDKVKEETKIIDNQYAINKSYSYSLNSLLSSVKAVIPSVPVVLLQEHYRCHPKIIDFCNKKFYGEQLIIMTKDNNEKDVITVIRTNKGNHSRDKTSQRQLDIIEEIIPKLTTNDIGIITPYNNQVTLLQEHFPNIEVSTVHKFQGREKDVIIISTVDDHITDFVANANILNVAISRAKKQLFFIITGNEITNKNIIDFINYVEYNNMEVSTSKIYSVFDKLYKQNEIERLNFYKKYNKVSNFDTENFIYYLIEEIVKSYHNLNFIFSQPLNTLIKDKSLLTEEEKKYATHHFTHIDFLIYNKLGKQPVLALEVDGYKYHKKGTKQYERDQLKNNILKKYNIPVIRLKTNGSREEKHIRDALDKIIKSQ